jgi:hypothetical protein
VPDGVHVRATLEYGVYGALIGTAIIPIPLT